MRTKARSKTKIVARTIDEYLAGVSDDKREALEKLRGIIKAAAPKAEECISYGLPGFRGLVSFAAWANHCACYAGALPIAVHKDALKDYDTSKGTIRFPPNKPLPAALVRKLIKTRIAENERRRRGAN